jgi:hypothetical protein
MVSVCLEVVRSTYTIFLARLFHSFEETDKQKVALTPKANRAIAEKDSPSLLCTETLFFCLYNKELRTRVEN